ncbi:hypothetical protein FNV43_RR25715 [Rhamnella rubrinervis]|uniref:Uncharacterized protein n=1 Tax=Rhamnella rubrinervis TaxID=2594499 RepID=A0A8K0DHI3_9ROSA|nr:hypothetical protein FNV43_RR25715 [Rhamnella rubrinervis]
MRESKKVISMVLVVTLAMVLMAGLVRCNNNINNGYIRPHHRRMGHAYADSNYTKMKKEVVPGPEDIKLCFLAECSLISQDCFRGCICFPFRFIAGNCVGSCC